MHTSKQSNKQTHKNTQKEKNKNTQDNRTGSKTEILKHTLGNGKCLLHSLLQLSLRWLTADWYDVLSVFVWLTDRSLSALCGRERQTEPPAPLHEPHGMSVILGTKIEVYLEDRFIIFLLKKKKKKPKSIITAVQMKDKDPGKKISHYYQHHAAPSSAPPPPRVALSYSSPSLIFTLYCNFFSSSRGPSVQ